MRVISASFRKAIESSYCTEVVLLFATITHPNLLIPVCVNNDIKDYVLGGNTFLGSAISISLLSDRIDMPQAKISIPNVDEKIGKAILGLRAAPQIKMEMYARSDFDTSDTRQAIGTPTPQYSAPFLFIRNIACDVLSFTGDLTSYDLNQEPYPSIRATKDRLPGLNR